jgi:hypothetical protein
MYNNLSFQVAIPSTGAMSVLSLAYFALPLSSLALYVTGSIWIPVLLATYVYVWKRGLPLFHSLLIAILAFSISRPLLPEQWSLYSLALLLLIQTRENMGHFLGLASSSTAFLAFNNGLLVRFFTPVSVSAFNWDIFVSPSPYVALWVAFRSLLALLYFTESFLVVLGRESVVHRAFLSLRPTWSLQKRRISPTEVGLA